MEPKTQAIILGISWFLVGGILYAGVAGIGLLASMSIATSLPSAFQATLGFVLCGLPFPVLLGWIPAAYRLASDKKGARLSAGIMGAIAIILLIVSFIILITTR